MSSGLLKKRGIDGVRRATKRTFRHIRIAVVHIAGVLKTGLKVLILRRNLNERGKIIKIRKAELSWKKRYQQKN